MIIYVVAEKMLKLFQNMRFLVLILFVFLSFSSLYSIEPEVWTSSLEKQVQIRYQLTVFNTWN